MVVKRVFCIVVVLFEGMFSRRWQALGLLVDYAILCLKHKESERSGAIYKFSNNA